MQIKGIEELTHLARGHASARLPIETHTSFPIPARGGRLLFLYCPSALRRDGLFLRPPDHLGRIDAATGALDSLRPVAPADFGQKHSPYEVLGKHDMRRAAQTPGEYHDLLRRLYQDHDLLLPHFFAGDSTVPAPAGRAAAELPALFSRVREGVLAPYYERLGEPFFGWLARVARP
ncbi:MAG: hypothetical protein IT372_13990 [Polyangiaceae bacterium]|nr:hypothetical protein [Polyangiaceae bacterium]